MSRGVPRGRGPRAEHLRWLRAEVPPALWACHLEFMRLTDARHCRCPIVGGEGNLKDRYDDAQRSLVELTELARHGDVAPAALAELLHAIWRAHDSYNADVWGGQPCTCGNRAPAFGQGSAWVAGS